MPQFRAAEQKARKDHVCDWCCQPIKSGQVYFYQAGVYDGDFSTLKYHLRCNDVVNQVMKDEGIDSYELSELQDIYHDYYK